MLSPQLGVNRCEYSIYIMKIRGKEVNPWKFIVVGWAVVRCLKLCRAFIKAQRLAKKAIKKELISRYDDL